jgi:hypothetical protein
MTSHPLLSLRLLVLRSCVSRQAWLRPIAGGGPASRLGCNMASPKTGFDALLGGPRMILTVVWSTPTRGGGATAVGGSGGDAYVEGPDILEDVGRRMIIVYDWTSALMRTSAQGRLGSLVANHTSLVTSP